MGTKVSENQQDKDFVENIIDNYMELEKSIVYQLKIYNECHPTTTGSLREDIWKQLFERIIPKKFVIEHSIFIIDSYYRISKEVDLAIIDNTYTPYIFQYGRLKYVPIEAVAAVVECKSTTVYCSKKTEDGKVVEAGLATWCSSIEALRTSRESVARMATGTVVEGRSYNYIAKGQENRRTFVSTQTSTRPIRIFCGYETNISTENESKIKKLFDFVLLASSKTGDGKIKITMMNRGSLQTWYKELDHYPPKDKEELNPEEKDAIVTIENEKLNGYYPNQLKVERNGEEISLLTFNLQLNQLLMLINNPILFPHFGYAKMFNKEERGEGN